MRARRFRCPMSSRTTSAPGAICTFHSRPLWRMRPAAREKGMRLASGGESDDRGTPEGAMLRPGAITALLAEMARCEPSEAPPALTPGTRVGRYEIIRPIGRGGFGAVYEGHDAALHRLVALKVLHRTPRAGPESASEGEAAARLAHPNIAALHDAGVLAAARPTSSTAPPRRDAGEPPRPVGQSRRARGSRSRRRSRAPSSMRTGRASSIATSSRRTCFSPSRAT